MSMYDNDHINTQGAGLCIPLESIKPTKLNSDFVWQGYNSLPIVYSIELAREIQKEVQKAFQLPEPLLYQVRPDLISVVGNEIKRFICALDGYYKSPNPVLPFKFLLDGILNEEFAPYLKKVRVASLTRTYKLESVEPDGLDKYPTYPIRDIGDIFNYRYWIRWEEPDPEAYKYAMVEGPPVHQDIKNLFEKTLKKMLPSHIPRIDPNEILLSNSSSSAVSPSGSKTKVWKEKGSKKNNSFSKDPLTGYRTLIYKCPTEYRDAITLDISQSNSVKLIEKQCAEIARRLDYSGYGFQPEEWEAKSEELRKDRRFFYNRDLTKEGLTKPRWILKSMGKVFKEKYPDIPAFDYFSIFDGFTLILENGTKLYTKRGHGLGMANALTTIMQCVIFSCIQELDYDNLFGDLDALFYNDDGSVGSANEDDLISYVTAEDDFLEQFGLLRKEEKTYYGKVSIFLEDYYPSHLNEKKSYYGYVARLPFSAPCVFAAKGQVHQLQLDSIPIEGRLIELLISLFGSESGTYEEYKFPWWAGGWCRPTFKEVDLSFTQAIPLNQQFARGVVVGPPPVKPQFFKKVKGVYNSPFEQVYGHLLPKFRRDLYDIYEINVPLATVAARYHKFTNSDEVSTWYFNQQVKRIKLWQSPAKLLSLPDYYYSVVEDNPAIDIIPPPGLMREKTLDQVAEYIVGRGLPVNVTQPNQKLGGISFFSEGETHYYINKVIPFPWFPDCSLHYKEVQPDKVEAMFDTYHSTSLFRAVGGYKTYPGYLIKRDSRVWINNYHVLEAYASITGKDVFPVPFIQNERARLLYEYRELLHYMDYHSSELHWKWWTCLGRTVPVLVMKWNLSYDEFIDIFDIEISEDSESPEETFYMTDVVKDVIDKKSVDFWTWLFNTDEYVKPGLLNVYMSGRQALHVSDLTRSLGALSASRRTETLQDFHEGSHMDLLLKNVCRLEGYHTQDGIYIYRSPQTEDDLWAQDGDDGGGFDSLFGCTED